MRQVVVGFTFGEIRMNDLILVMNLMGDRRSLNVAKSLKCMSKHKISEDEVRWWLEERLRCNTYGKYIFVYEQ